MTESTEEKIDAFKVLNGIIEKMSDVSANCASVIDSELKRLRILALQMRCCQNCVNTPFNGLNYHTHCGHWLKRECSENRGHPFYMRKWEFGELDGRQNRERTAPKAETEV